MTRERMRKFYQLALALSIGLVVHVSQAAVIFQDDFQTNTIDPAKWNVEGGNSPFVYDLGAVGMGSAGDYALWVVDQTFTYTGGVRSDQSFNRALGLTASFKLMVQPKALPTDDYLFTGIDGPWSNVSALQFPPDDYPSLRRIEAGISRRSGESYHWVEGTQNFDTVGLSPAFRTALESATSKAVALDVKVTLGTSTGARIEWSVGGGPVTVEHDTIGLLAGTNYAGSNLVSSMTPLWLYFGGATNNSNVLPAVIDDIVVTTIPEPASLALMSLGMMAICAVRRNRP